MPIPSVVASLNRYTFNPIVRQFAGRVAPLALIVHRGRTSGDEYRTPVMTFPSKDGFVIALVYGRGTDWGRNVHAADGCVMVYRSRSHALTAPVPLPEEDARGALPVPVRIVLAMLGVHEFLHLTTTGRQ